LLITGGKSFYRIEKKSVNTKSIYAALLAVLVPLVCYFIVKRSSESAIHMPRHYLADSVITTVKNGKQSTDTVWHRLPEISLTNQLGQKVVRSSSLIFSLRIARLFARLSRPA